MYHKYSELFKELVRIEVVKRFPRSSRGRPVSLTFQDAWDSIILILRTGMQWRSLVPKTASYITVFKTMHLWMKSNVFKTAYTNLLRLYRRQRRTKYYCVDSTHVKNVYGRDCKGRNHADRGRFSTKLSAVISTTSSACLTKQDYYRNDVSFRNRPIHPTTSAQTFFSI